jgi:hypothetical protein
MVLFEDGLSRKNMVRPITGVQTVVKQNPQEVVGAVKMGTI